MPQVESAGGIIVNSLGQVVIVSQRDGTWSLPKGHVEPGETLFAAALREIAEETGLRDLICIAGLGYHDRSARHEVDGTKRVHLFLFATHQEHLAPSDADNAEARWVDVREAVRLIGNDGDAARLANARRDVARARDHVAPPARERTLE